jgi:hypothetical protein
MTDDVEAMVAAIDIMLRDTSRLQAIQVLRAALLRVIHIPHQDAPPDVGRDFAFSVAVIRYLVGSLEPFDGDTEKAVSELLGDRLNKWNAEQRNV